MNPTTVLSTPKSSFGTPNRPAINGNGTVRSPARNGNGITPAAPSDFTLYDKARLLRLAERSEPRKDVTRTARNTPIPAQSQSHNRSGVGVNGNSGFSTPLGKLEKLSNGNGTVRAKAKNATSNSNACANDFATPSPSPGANNFSSKARSKLYASFSSKKSKLIKRDPAKTNIEHLVKSTRAPSSSMTNGSTTKSGGSSINVSHNYYNGSDSGSTCSSITNHCNSIERPVTPFHEEPVDTSFHNHAKLVNAFSPTPSTLSSASSSSMHSLAKRSQHGLLSRNHNGKYYAMQNEVSPTHENGKEQPQSLLMHAHSNRAEDPLHGSSHQSQSNAATAAAAMQHHQPRISSAQIVSLSRKASFPSPTKTDDGTNQFSTNDPFRQPQAYNYNTKAIENQSRAAAEALALRLHDGSSAWLHDSQNAENQSSPSKTMAVTNTRCSIPSTSPSSQLLSKNGAAIIPPPPISSRKTVSKQSESETESMAVRARQQRRLAVNVNMNGNGSAAGQSPAAIVDARSDNSQLYSHGGTRMQMQTEFFPQSQSQPQPQMGTQRVSSSSGNNYYYNSAIPPRPVELVNNAARSRTALVFDDNLTNEVPDTCATGRAGANHDSYGYDEWSRRGSRNTEASSQNADDSHRDRMANFYNRNVDEDENELQPQSQLPVSVNNCAAAGAYNCLYNYDMAANDGEDSADPEAKAAFNTSAAADDEDFDRKKTRSLPRSLTSMKTGLRNVKLPSLWNPHNQEKSAFEAADERTLISNRHPDVKIAPSGSMLPKSSMAVPENSERISSQSTRQHRQQQSQSSQRTKGRPKSVDYSQRNSWMKVYSNMDLASVNGKASSKSPSPMNSPTEEKPNSSISRLHLIDSSEDVRQWRSATREEDKRALDPAYQRDSPDYSSGIGSNSSRSNSLTEQNKEARARLGSASTAAASTASVSANNSQSLFQRFSKTFSLRFGGVAKDLEHQSSSRKKLKQNRRHLGSSPDLVSRLGNETDKRNSTDSTKHRRGSQKAVRDDKCQSGDSGIQVLDPENDNRSKRPLSRGSNVNRQLRNSMNRLSLVEFPNQNGKQKPNRQTSLLSTNTVSYEDLLDGRLDDDGFISNDEYDDDLVQVDEEEEDDEGFNKSVLQKSPDNAYYEYYHSLPAKYLRRKRTTEKSTPNAAEKSASVRGNIIRELLTTEQKYVKILNDIVQGYLIPSRQAKHLFSPKIVSHVFSNVEDLLKLHLQFLHDLQYAIEHSHGQNGGEGISQAGSGNYCSSLVGHVFIVWSDQFHHLYSDYCCQNTMSIVTLRQLTSMSSEYVDFFENCRRRQLMDKLPLHGFLLRPIQRICQYHLQLNELVKHTPVTHDDFEAVTEALERMKLVATNVNETQRQFDELQELAKLQISIEGFEGPDLLDRNTTILHRGDLVQMNQGSRHKEVYVIVLNQEVVICRKDSSKKGALTMNTRIDLNSSVWVNIDSNDEDDYFGMVHNSWRLYNPYKSGWILFTASSPIDKRKWTSALEQTIEQDKFHISAKMREMAKLTATQILLTDSLLSFSTSPTTASSGSAGQNNTSTLPKLKKNGNRKSLTKTGNGDASSSRTDLLINDVKLRSSKNCNTSNSHSGSNNAPVRTSKFYV